MEAAIMHHLNTRAVLLLCSLGGSLIAGAASVPDESVGLFEQSPVSVSSFAGSAVLIDFGRVAFGNVQLTPPEGATGTVTVHFGERLKDGRVDRQPPGTVRYNVAKARLRGGRPLVVAPPADARNTEQIGEKHPPAVLTPPDAAMNRKHLALLAEYAPPDGGIREHDHAGGHGQPGCRRLVGPGNQRGDEGDRECYRVQSMPRDPDHIRTGQ